MKFPVATDPSGVVCRPKPGTAKLEGTGPGKALFKHPKGTEFQNHQNISKDIKTMMLTKVRAFDFKLQVLRRSFLL
jgi:hypothetical protein